MSFTHQDVAQLVNNYLVEITEEHNCSTEAAIGGCGAFNTYSNGRC
ncbi:hypothetical protein NVP1088O_65 [Vibrio phage 1.088.O._10N.261.46.A1]|nr:hypothetical protein NVP1088O_65 [Vibrio phage 1.088.O._10N.261.46.A1]